MFDRFARSFLGLCGLALMASTAVAQTSQVCFNDSVPLQPTDYDSSVTIPKFDPILGDLVSIEFTLSGYAEGDAQVESLNPAPSVANTTFSSELTLERPDMSTIVVTLPLAMFTDPLAPYDGTLDFMGPSSASHLGVMASDSDSVTSPPPASDLILFTGPGSITLPVRARGMSSASGSGNFAAIFTQRASASVTVCYNYLPNTPPSFDGLCGSTIGTTAGMPFTFQVCASDVDPGDLVTLEITSGPLPPGATLAPPLPITANPACTVFNWTPTVFDIGLYVFTFYATDSNGRTATCTIIVIVSECYQFLGRGGGNAGITIGGQYFQSQLGSIRQYFPVTMIDRPSLRIPSLTSGELSFSVQTVMYNVDMFPTNPDQWGERLRVIIYPGQVVAGELYGTLNGIHQQLTTFTDPFGDRWMTFPFTIDGM